MRDLRTLMELFSICMHSKKVNEIVLFFLFYIRLCVNFCDTTQLHPKKVLVFIFQGTSFHFNSKPRLASYRNEQFFLHFRMAMFPTK